MKKEKKQKKSKKKNLNYRTNSYTDNEATKVVMILVGIVLFLGLFYLLAMVMTGEIKFGKEKKEPTVPEIRYDMILAGQSLNQDVEEYYVLYFDSSEKISDSYISYRDNYVNSTEYLPMYMVDLASGFNTEYIDTGEEERIELPENIKDLKVKDPTILRIKEGKVVDRIEGREEVNEFLKELN